MATVGKSVKITCKADAFPPPKYKIFHNSTELTDVINGVKTIMSTNYHDSGQYKCIAKNSRGNMFEMFNLTVKGEICVKTCLSEMVPFGIKTCRSEIVSFGIWADFCRLRLSAVPI